MTQHYKEMLNQLSNEQLIYLIEQLNHSLFLIGETCVNESKNHIDSDKAVNEIRNYIYRMPNCYDISELKAYIDMKMGKISIKKYKRIIGLED